MALTNQVSAQAMGGKKAKLPAMFPWPMGELIIPDSGCGLGNPMTTNAKNMAEPWREQIGFFIFTRDGGTGALSMAGSTKIDFWQTGTGEAPPSNSALTLPWVQNESGTNLFPKGAPVTRDNLFAAGAFGIGAGRPFALVQNEGGTAYLAERHFAPWCDSYGQRIRDAFWTLFGMSVTFQNAACNFELGTPSNYVPQGGQLGGDTVRAGGGFGVLGMLPVDRGPVYLGAQDEQNQGKITFTSCEEEIVLDQDDMIPTVGDLAIPILLTAYGEYGPWCGPCGPDQADLQQAVMATIMGMAKSNPAALQAMLAASNGK